MMHKALPYSRKVARAGFQCLKYVPKSSLACYALKDLTGCGKSFFEFQLESKYKILKYLLHLIMIYLYQFVW